MASKFYVEKAPLLVVMPHPPKKNLGNPLKSFQRLQGDCQAVMDKFTDGPCHDTLEKLGLLTDILDALDKLDDNDFNLP